MRTVFEILSPDVDPAHSTLLCEVNNEGFAFAVKHDARNSFDALGIYHYDTTKPSVGLPISLKIIFHQKEIFSHAYHKVKIVYSLPQSVLVPAPLYRAGEESEVMNMLYGDLQDSHMILTDNLPSLSYYNCYRIPDALHEVVQSRFPQASCMHQHTLLLKKAAEGADRLQVIFYSRKIVVCLVQEGRVALVNSYPYQSPEDVSYILLNICKQSAAGHLPVFAEGLIEQHSALYKEVYNYFSVVEMAPWPDGYHFFDEITHYPSHYFSNIYAIDECG